MYIVVSLAKELKENITGDTYVCPDCFLTLGVNISGDFSPGLVSYDPAVMHRTVTSKCYAEHRTIFGVVNTRLQINFVLKQIDTNEETLLIN